jgi:two-component system, NarL family, nitrate/nitrite response regulator NarL
VIIDDSEEFLSSARLLLELQGLDVVGVARSRAEALELVEDVSPDLALVDVELGEDDGVALTTELADRAPEMQSVLISAHDRYDISELMSGSRAAGFLSKTDLGADAIRELISS